MEAVVLIALVALLARGAWFLGMMEARAGRTGDGVVDGLNGMFALSREYSRSGELGWPHGVQEEDRDRIWRWTAPDTAAADLSAEEGDVIDRDGHFSGTLGALIDTDVAPVPVQRVR